MAAKDFPGTFGPAMQCYCGAVLMQSLKILDCPFMFLSFFTRAERPQVPAPAGLRVLLPRIQPILSGFELSNHALFPGNRGAIQAGYSRL
jgi:hypothetical protein